MFRCEIDFKFQKLVPLHPRIIDSSSLVVPFRNLSRILPLTGYQLRRTTNLVENLLDIEPEYHEMRIFFSSIPDSKISILREAVERRKLLKDNRREKKLTLPRQDPHEIWTSLKNNLDLMYNSSAKFFSKANRTARFPRCSKKAITNPRLRVVQKKKRKKN